MKPTTAAFLLLCASASADEVVLPNGARIRGDVREENDRVVVRLDSGTMSFPRGRVRIVRTASEPQRELDARTENATSAQDYHDAAVFAKSKHLDRRAEELHRRALELDPGHEGSRAALGYAKVDGRWLRGDELFAALGYVKRGAQWVTRETAAAIDERLRAEEQAKAEEIRQANRTAAEAGEIERRRLGLAAAVEREKSALERRRLEIERELALKAGPPVAAAYPGPAYPAAGMERLPFQGHEPGCRAPGAVDCCRRPWYYTVDRRGAGPPIKGPSRR